MKIFDAHQDISDAILYSCHTDFFVRNGLHDGWNDLKLPVNNQSDFERLKEGNVSAVFGVSCAVGVDEKGGITPSPDHFRETLRHINLYHQLHRARPNDINLILSRKDVAKIDSHRLSFLLAIEGADSLAERPDHLETFFNLGIRSIGLTWSFNNGLAGGCNEDGHLTETGKTVIREMERLGIVFDLSHINRVSMFEALEVAQKPVFMSHTCCKAVHDHERNVDDDQLRAIKETGGLVGIAGVPKFVGGMSIEKVADHFVHAIEVMGVDHVCSGSDFGAMTAEKLIPDFYDVTCLPALFEALEKRGLSEEDREKVAYRNLEKYLSKALPE